MVVIQRQWPGDAGAGEQQALLGFQVGNVLDRPQRQRMAGVLARQGIEQARDILRCDRPEAQPALRSVQFYQRL